MQADRETSQRRDRLRRLAVWAAGMLAVSCTDPGPRAPASGAADKVFRYSLADTPGSLDPVRASTVYQSQVILNLFDTLYEYKFLQRPYELKPALASALPVVSADGLTYTITLRTGQRFMDDPAFPDGVGREITAADVVYSLQRQFDPANKPAGTWLWQDRIVGLDEWKQDGSDYAVPVAGLRALDTYVLQIQLKRPYPQLVYTLAMASAAIVPREAVAFYGREFSINPVGSGPFRLAAFDSARAVLVPNPNYRREPLDLKAAGYDPATQGGYGLEQLEGRAPPFLDRLEISFVGESSARWSSFTKTDELQFTSLPNEQLYRVLESTNPVRLKEAYAREYHMQSALEAGLVFNVFNMSFPELGYHPDPVRNERNHALRCAIIKGFDWEARNESFYGGLGVIFPGIIPPVVAEFDPTLSRASVTYDPAGARALLAEHGWTADNLPTLEYGTTPGPTLRLFFEQFRAWMKRIGYPPEKIVLKNYATFGDISKAWRNSELPLIMSGWRMDYPDAENTLQLFYGPNGSPGSNSANYRNPAYDALYRQASVMQPSPERTQLYRQMNRMLVDDCVANTGISRRGISLWHRNVITYPDSSFLGGRFLKYVDIAAERVP